MSIYTYRLVPVHYTDVDGMESWLEEMAAKGYVLGQEGIFSGLVAFEKTEPKHYKYRLIANPFKYGWTGGRFNRYAPVPDEKTQEFHREFGWEYVATRKDFNIYVAKDPNAPEMDTDPQIQATAIHAAAKRKLWDMFWISLIILVDLLFWFGSVASSPIGTRISFGVEYLFQLPLWVLFFAQYVYAYVRLKKIEKSLLSGLPLEHKSDYRKYTPVYWASRCVAPLLIIAIIITIRNVNPRYTDYASRIDLNSYTGDIPFATMEQLLPEAELREDIAWDNCILVQSSFLSETYKLYQHLHITLPDGTETSGSLGVIYWKTGSPKAARFFADSEHSRSQRSHYEPRELTIEGIDYAFAYSQDFLDYVVLCKGGTFVQVSFHIFDCDPITAQQIGQIMADSLPGGSEE